MSFVRRNRVALTLAFCALALSVGTIAVVSDVVSSDTAPLAQQSNAQAVPIIEVKIEGGNDLYMNITPQSNHDWFEVDPSTCRVDLKGITTVKRPDGICEILVDTPTYPMLGGRGGWCAQLNTTSPRNTEFTRVIELRSMPGRPPSEQTFAFNLYRAMDVVVNDISFYEPGFQGFVLVDDRMEFTSCATLPEDPN